MNKKVLATSAMALCLSVLVSAPSMASVNAVVDLGDFSLTNGYTAPTKASVATSAELNTVAGNVTNVSNRVSTVETAVNDATSGLAALNTKVNTATTAMNDATSGLAAVNTKVNTVTDAVNDATSGLGALNTKVNTATTALNEATTGLAALNTKVADVVDDLAVETQARINADTTLQANINTNTTAIADEQTARVNADAALQTQINTHTTAIADEQTARVNADTQIRTDFTDADTQIRNDFAVADQAIKDEMHQVDANLQAGIAAEGQARADADTALHNSILAEGQARADADTALHNSILAEGQARDAADTAIRNEFAAADNAIKNVINGSGNGSAGTALNAGSATNLTEAVNQVYQSTANRDDALGDIINEDGTLNSNALTTNAKDLTGAVNELDASRTQHQNAFGAIIDENGNHNANALTTTADNLTDAVNELDADMGTRQIASKNQTINNALSQNVTAAFEATGNALGDLDFSNTHYLKGSTDLSSSVRTLDSTINGLDHRLGNLEDETKAGFASTAALAGLVPNARANGNTQLALGSGTYRGKVGGALGLYHYVNDNVLLNAGVAYAGEKSTIGKAGVTFGW